MELFIVMRNTAQNRDRLFDRRFIDRHGLEAALERRVLFDIFAVLVKRCRADDLNLDAREGGLEDIRRVHRAFCVARANQVVHLVDDKDDVAELFDLVDEALHAAFKLAPELRARDERGQVHQIDLLTLQLVGYFLVYDPLRQSLGNRRFADAGLTDQTRVILLPPV